VSLRAAAEGRAWMGWALLAAVVAFLAFDLNDHFRLTPGVDLWQPWGIARVRAEVAGAASPYAAPGAYGRRLAEDAAAGDANGQEAATARYWARRGGHAFEPTGTPAVYASMSWLPARLDAARVAWGWLSAALAAWAAYALARSCRATPLGASWMAAAALALFDPLLMDLDFGNVACVQLAALVWIVRTQRSPRELRSRMDRLVPVVLGALVALKPNIVPVAAALLAQRMLVAPPRQRMSDLFGAGCGLAAMAAIGALYLGPGSWVEWWRYLNGANGGTVAYSAASGNMAVAAWLAGSGGAGRATGDAMLLAAAFSILVAGATALGARGVSPGRALRRRMSDAGFAASAGVLMMAAAPLYWYHYNVLMLVPLARLLAPPARAAVRALAAASLVFLSMPWIALAGLWGDAGLLFWRLPWAPLLLAFLLDAALGEPRSGEAAARPVAKGAAEPL
jgi:hypothetical protein